MKGYEKVNLNKYFVVHTTKQINVYNGTTTDYEDEYDDDTLIMINLNRTGIRKLLTLLEQYNLKEDFEKALFDELEKE